MCAHAGDADVCTKAREHGSEHGRGHGSERHLSFGLFCLPLHCSREQGHTPLMVPACPRWKTRMWRLWEDPGTQWQAQSPLKRSKPNQKQKKKQSAWMAQGLNRDKGTRVRTRVRTRAYTRRNSPRCKTHLCTRTNPNGACTERSVRGLPTEAKGVRPSNNHAFNIQLCAVRNRQQHGAP